MDLLFPTANEIVQLLCSRLRQERLMQEFTQCELAARAGIGTNTLSNLEAGRNVSFATLVRVAMALGREKELTELFAPRVSSLDDIKKYEASKVRQRIRERKHD